MVLVVRDYRHAHTHTHKHTYSLHKHIHIYIHTTAHTHTTHITDGLVVQRLSLNIFLNGWSLEQKSLVSKSLWHADCFKIPAIHFNG